MPPAIAWLYFSNFPRGKKLNPNVADKTRTSIVAIVTDENKVQIRKRPLKLNSEAGYISIEISGSHGPKTKMVNNIQGVIFCL